MFEEPNTMTAGQFRDFVYDNIVYEFPLTLYYGSENGYYRHSPETGPVFVTWSKSPALLFWADKTADIEIKHDPDGDHVLMGYDLYNCIDDICATCGDDILVTFAMASTRWKSPRGVTSHGNWYISPIPGTENAFIVDGVFTVGEEHSHSYAGV